MKSVTDFIDAQVRHVNEEHARTMALVAARLLTPFEQGGLTPASAAVLLREIAEGIMKRAALDPGSLPPWPENAPDRETWAEYAVGERR